jgi:hypothetical protein
LHSALKTLHGDRIDQISTHMALSVGAHIGSYEILAPIGAGGMGEVYRATDTKLRRDTPLSRYFFCCGRGSEAGGTIFFIRKYTTMLP